MLIDVDAPIGMSRPGAPPSSMLEKSMKVPGSGNPFAIAKFSPKRICCAFSVTQGSVPTRPA